jgi:exopolysaccharide production protein ExoZ
MILSLQYARGVAALLVVYFHATRQFKAFSPANDSFVQLGEFGVDIFFVLSGFVMWITTSTSHDGTVDFLKRRLIRIVPLYWAVTIAAGACALAFPSALRSTVFDLQHWLASLFFVPWPNPVSPEGRLAPIVVPGWTLNYEMFFYAAFGVALLLSVRHRAWALGLLFAGLFAGATASGSTSPVLGFYGSSIIFEFLLGVLIAMAYEHDRLLATPVGWFLLGISTMAIVAIELSFDNEFPAIARGVPAALIVYALVSIEARKGCIRSPGLLLLGAASFSIYLTHVFTLAALRVAWKQAGLGVTDHYGAMFLAIAVVFSAVVGTIVHLYYEQPVVTFLKRRLAPTRQRRASFPATAGSFDAEPLQTSETH